MKKLFCMILLTLLLTSTLTLAFNIQTVKAGIIVVPYDYPTIQEAINAASPGDTIYVRKGTYGESIVVNKTVVLVGENKEDTIIQARDYPSVDVWESVVTIVQDKVSIANFTIRNGLYGIHLDGSSENSIYENNITDNRRGIYFDFSSNNTIYRNNIGDKFVWGPSSYGVYLDWSSNNNIYGNIFYHSSYCIYLYQSSGNSLFENIINSGYSGIHLDWSSNNHIYENNVTNGSYAIYFRSSSSNRVFKNNIINNDFGIYLDTSLNNGIFHNNIINNTYQVPFYTYGYANFWDDGYPSGGNHWSDYTGVDDLSGPYQNETGSDGIGDTPYIIDAKNRDRYPLMNPWTPPPTPDFSLTASPTSLIIQQSDLATSTITIASVNGFDQPVQLTVSGAPTGVTTTLSPEQVTPPPDGSTTSSLTVSVSPTATLGSHTLTLTGTSGTLIHSVNVSLEITAVPPIITFDLSPGWGTKELFVPIFYRFREEPSTFALGVHNRRDMWYLVEVYRRRPDQDWERIYPWDLPYLQPWGERTFSYTPQAGDEIKIAVWNDLNDEGLRNLWVLDFTTRTIFRVSISPQVTNPQEFKVKLATFYNEILTAVGYMRIGEWKKAALELGNILATSIKAREALVSVLKHVGIEVTTEVIKALLIPFRYIKNILSTGAWRLITNANKEPFTEEVIFTAKEKTPPAVPDVKVTKGLTIVQNEPYYVGQTITAQFTITNKGTAPITFNILTVGGRGPKGDADIRDFTFKTDITLNAGDSYNYHGELKLLDNGTYHFFIAYQTPDGKWETSVPAEAGATNTVDIFVNPIPEKWIAAELGSPAELRVSDSQGRIAGLTNGVEKIEIPHSTYYENIVVILAPADSYKYEVVGTSEGSYKLIILNGTAQKIATFNATDIPTTANAIHRYTVDWAALTRGEKGVTIQIDSDGDGMFELTFTSDSELTREEFMLQITPKEAFPLWIVGAVVAIIATVSAGVAVFWRKRKQHVAKG